MTDNPNYVPRLNVDLTEEMSKDLNALLPWGIRKHIIHKVLLALFDLLRRDKQMAIGALLSGDVVIRLEVKQNEPA
jgi:hypothetical protein